MRPDALCTLEAAKIALGLPPSSGAEDVRISLLIEAATDIIERGCGRKFVRRNYNDGDIAATPTFHLTTAVPDEERFVFDGCGQTTIVLPNFPIVDDDDLIFETLATRSNAGGDTWDTLVKNEDYVVDRKRGMLRLNGGRLVYGVRNYRVTYEGGFIDAGKAPWVPSDLQQLCVEMVKEGANDAANVTSETIGSWSRSYDLSKPNPFLEAAMNKYTADSNFL